MKLIDSFSTTTQLIPKNGYIYEKYYPLPFDNYIVLNTQNEDLNSNYIFWNRVIQLITPTLEEKKLKVIQFVEDKKFNFDHFVIDKNVSIFEKAYILKRAKFFCGSSKLYSLICSEYGVKQCLLKYDYSIDNCLASDSETIESNFKRKAFVNPAGNNINNIRPEEIARRILFQIDSNNDINFDNTICIGKVYSVISIDLIPDCSFKIGNQNSNNEVLVRMDYLFSEENLEAQLINMPCSIATNKKIKKEILIKYKNRIKKIFFKVEKNSDPSFLNDLEDIELNYDIITSLSDDDLKLEKGKYLNYKKINRLSLVDLSFLDNLDKEKIYFRTNKIIIKNGTTFGSRWHLKNNIPCKDVRNTSFAIPTVIDDSFREEADNFYFLTSETI